MYILISKYTIVKPVKTEREDKKVLPFPYHWKEFQDMDLGN